MDEARRDAFAGRVFEAGLATMDLFSVYLGERLGLYRVLSRTGPSPPPPSPPVPGSMRGTHASGWSSRP